MLLRTVVLLVGLTINIATMKPPRRMKRLLRRPPHNSPNNRRRPRLRLRSMPRLASVSADRHDEPDHRLDRPAAGIALRRVS